MRRLFRIFSLFFLIVGCGILSSFDTSRENFKLDSVAYVLQADLMEKKREKAVTRLAATDRDLIILDYAYTTGIQGLWTKKEIETIRKGKPGRRVVAYISIGEAEDYRFYWKKKWDRNRDGKPDKKAPEFLHAVNPNWAGNYKVKYWKESWQGLILQYLKTIQKQGFDGIYMDIIDAYEYFEYEPKSNRWLDHRKNPETGNSYRQDMINWVQKIAGYTRKKDPGFLLIPQNGTGLLENENFRKMIDAIGVEDLFTSGDNKQSKEHVDYNLKFLAHMKKEGKPVLLVEYGVREEIRKHSIHKAKQQGFPLLLTDRPLATIGICPAILTDKEKKP